MNHLFRKIPSVEFANKKKTKPWSLSGITLKNIKRKKFGCFIGSPYVAHVKNWPGRDVYDCVYADEKCNYSIYI